MSDEPTVRMVFCADPLTPARLVARMVELQGDSLAGGIVLRRFENYRQHSGRTAEARVWWVDGVAAGEPPADCRPERRRFLARAAQLAAARNSPEAQPGWWAAAKRATQRRWPPVSQA